MKNFNFEKYFSLILFVSISFLHAGDGKECLKEQDMFAFSENKILSAAQKKYIPQIEEGEFFVGLEAYAALMSVYKKVHESPSKELSTEFKNRKSLCNAIFSFHRVKQNKNLII